jgi:hypothetical protein
MGSYSSHSPDHMALAFYSCYLQAQNRLHAAEAAWVVALVALVAGVTWLLITNRKRQSRGLQGDELSVSRSSGVI